MPGFLYLFKKKSSPALRMSWKRFTTKFAVMYAKTSCQRCLANVYVSVSYMKNSCNEADSSMVTHGCSQGLLSLVLSCLIQTILPLEATSFCLQIQENSFRQVMRSFTVCGKETEIFCLEKQGIISPWKRNCHKKCYSFPPQFPMTLVLILFAWVVKKFWKSFFFFHRCILPLKIVFLDDL
jgi:hypothetical protein